MNNGISDEINTLACIKQVGDPTTPPMIEYCSCWERVSEIDPEIVVCMQESETREQFVRRVETVANWICE